MRKFIWRCIAYISIPIILSLITTKIISIELPILIIIYYGVLLFFLIPSDVYFGSTLDYNTKAINHTYRSENNKFKEDSKDNLYYVLIVVLCLITTLLSWYCLTK